MFPLLSPYPVLVFTCQDMDVMMAVLMVVLMVVVDLLRLVLLLIGVCSLRNLSACFVCYACGVVSIYHTQVLYIHLSHTRAMYPSIAHTCYGLTCCYSTDMFRGFLCLRLSPVSFYSLPYAMSVSAICFRVSAPSLF